MQARQHSIHQSGREASEPCMIREIIAMNMKSPTHFNCESPGSVSGCGILDVILSPAITLRSKAITSPNNTNTSLLRHSAIISLRSLFLLTDYEVELCEDGAFSLRAMLLPNEDHICLIRILSFGRRIQTHRFFVRFVGQERNIRLCCK